MSVFRSLPGDAPALLAALAREDERHPLARKLVVAPAAGAGREVLRTLARLRGGWTGFEVTTLRPLAARTAVEWIASEGVRVADAFEEEARMDEALDLALEAGADPLFVELADGPGFRRAVRDALTALRLTGVDGAAVGRYPFEDPRKRDLLADALARYEAGLTDDRVTDVAGVLDRAARALERGTTLPAERVLLMPGLGLRGRAGAFVAALERHGAVRLPADPVPGLEPPRGVLWREAPAPAPAPEPDLHLFRAAGVHAELREVLRRVLATGRPWDDVEIVTPDPGVYGPALHSLGARLGIATTFAVGLPVGRTRPGRAVTAWFRWIADDCPAPVLRRLLETGDLVPPGRTAPAPWLARTLRGLRIGWGRDRYRPLVAAALERRRAEEPRAGRYGSLEQARERRARAIRDLTALDRLLAEILEAAPDPRRRVSPARVARGLRAFLALVPAEGEVDRSAHERLTRLLDRIIHTLNRPTRFATALATVRDHLEIRVPAPRAEGKAPWLSDGGALHLTDLEHGGLSGRPLVFLVGMDAGRFPGHPRQDPFLLDRERRALPGDLPVTEDRMAEARFRLAALLARTRGTVTVSYPAWDAAEARLLQPSSALLPLLRRQKGDPHLGYADLDAHLEAPASRIPRGRPPLDGDDVWLEALADGDRLLDGRAALRERHAPLDRGLAAAEAPHRPDPSPHVGILTASDPRAARLDPRRDSGPRLSPSALETLGSCPLRYFYQRVLWVEKPDDPDFDPERWLPARERGSLLHDVFQAAVEDAEARGTPFDSPDFAALARTELDRRAERMRRELPPPGESVYRAELNDLAADVRSFCAHLAATGLAPDQVVATEMVLGGEAPVTLALPGGGALRIRGRVDRLDRLDRGLRVVDYKTGKDWGHGPKDGVYRGGRRLQHVLYARAVEAQHPELGPVASVEYHFPTVRGRNGVHPYPAETLSDGLELVDRLVDMAAAARFPATDDPDDCRYCDYAEVCRFGAALDEKGRESAPRVEWTRQRREEGHPAVSSLAAVRDHEADG